jgi:hypothetical protein
MWNRTNGLILVISAVAGGCWGGALDPIVAASLGEDAGVDADSDADSDSDGDSDGDSDVDTETETNPVCNVPLIATFYNEVNWELDQDTCSFNFGGECMAQATECTGCAWSSSNGCADGEVCCVAQETVQSCDLKWDETLYCGYQDNDTDCDYRTIDTDVFSSPACRDEGGQEGTFCCIIAS